MHIQSHRDVFPVTCRNLPVIMAWVETQRPGVNGVNIITSDFVELVDFANTVIRLNDLLLLLPPPDRAVTWSRWCACVITTRVTRPEWTVEITWSRWLWMNCCHIHKYWHPSLWVDISVYHLYPFWAKPHDEQIPEGHKISLEVWGWIPWVHKVRWVAQKFLAAPGRSLLVAKLLFWAETTRCLSLVLVGQKPLFGENVLIGQMPLFEQKTLFCLGRTSYLGRSFQIGGRP